MQPDCHLCFPATAKLAVAVVGVLYHDHTRSVGVPVCAAHRARLRATEPAHIYWEANLPPTEEVESHDPR